MIPTKNELDIYFRHLVTNYDDLIKLMADAKVDLNTILGATDKPVPKSESLAIFVLETALTIALPEARIFMMAKNMITGAKKMVETGKKWNGYVQKVEEARKLIAEMNSAANDVKTDYHNGALKMIGVVNQMSDQLYKHKTLAMKQWDLLSLVLGNKNAAPLFNEIDWKNPPKLVSEKSDEVRYMLTYMLVRLAVFKFVKLKVYRWDPYGWGAGQRIVKFKPEGISEAGCQHIFANFTRKMGGAGPWPGTPGTPAAHRIVPIRNFQDMAENWAPDIELVGGDWDDLVKAADPKKPRVEVTRDMILSDLYRKTGYGSKVNLEVVRTTPDLLQAL